MPSPRVTFANPRTSVRAYLDGVLSVPVNTAYPTSPPTGGYVQVAWDGTPQLNYPITIRATIRVTCWHVNPTPAETLALEVTGWLATHGGDTYLWSVIPLTGPLSGADEASGWFFASSTYRVSPRPIVA